MVFIVAKWNVIILIKKNMYMKKEKGAEILMKKRRNIQVTSGMTAVSIVNYI